MTEVEILDAVGNIAQGLTVTSLLLTWIFLERRARNILSNKILEDWDDMRRERSTKKAGEK